MKRLSRSDSSMMVASRSALAVVVEGAGQDPCSAPAAPRMEASGVLRSCEIEVSSAERSRSASTVRLARRVLDQMDALDRQRRLVDQRVEQAPLVGREQRAGLVAVDADDADGAAAGAHRQEQPLGAGQRIGAAPGGAVVLPGPFGGGEIGLVERVLGRIAGLDRDRCRPRAAAAPPAPSASARSGRPSPTARRRACRRRPACG